jgi:type II secretory pathway pseudopilin PulG
MRRGLTLIELLIVCFIIVLFVGIAAPLLRPNPADAKVREAARQVSAYFAQAKAYAAGRQKNVAVVFDRRTASLEGARDSNVLDFDLQGANPMLEVITKSYFSNPPQPGDSMPFYARVSPYPVGGSPAFPSPVAGPAYAGLAVWQGATPGIPGNDLQFFIVAQFNQPLWKTTIPTPPNPYPPGLSGKSTACFSIAFPPQPSPTNELQLPTGTCVDLQYSGQGITADYFDATRASGAQLALIFDPMGQVWKIQNGQRLDWPNGRTHLLIGQTARAIDAPGQVAGSNLADTVNYWISVSSQTGLVETARNAGASAPLPQAIEQARALALSHDTVGGR